MGNHLLKPMEYAENRAKLPLAELRKHQGRWVAFSLDGRRIIASHDDVAELDAIIVAAGEDPQCVAFERIELDDICLGGAELQ